jgi:membrane protease YdiL (CAAX protease family)
VQSPDCANDSISCLPFARKRAGKLAGLNNQPVGDVEQQASTTLQPIASSGWSIADAAIIGVVGYVASVFFLLVGMATVFSIPSLRSRLHFYGLDVGVYTLLGLVGGIVFSGPLVMWFVRRRNIGSLARSIEWECNNRTFGWSLLFGFVSGIVYSIVRAALAGRGYRPESVESIIAFVLLAGLAQPILEEIYFRGILFVALTRKFRDTSAIVLVTFLFCVAHPQNWFTVLPVAVLLGGIRLYTRSVKACLACHAAYNLSLVLFMLPIGN